MEIQVELRKLPSVDRLLQEETVAALVTRWGHELTVEAAREVLDTARDAIRRGGPSPQPVGAAARASGPTECATPWQD